MLQAHGGAVMPSRVSECAFFDIYLSNNATQKPMVRGLRPLADAGYERVPGVMFLPDSLQQDASTLLGCIETRFLEAADGEFVVQHDGVHYRASLIAPAGSLEAARASACRDWCVRRIGSEAPRLDEVEIPPDIVASLREAGKDRGLVLISGPFGSGKSTTASASVVDWVVVNRESAVTLEDPPEFPIAGRYPGGGIIHQIGITQSNLAESIVHARRWSPRYVFLGEIRTPVSAAELLHLSISGPLTLCTVHASDLVQAIASLARFAGSAIGDEEARRMIAASLRLVVHQDLSWGRMIARRATFHPQGAQAIRNKIETGRFNSLYEDFDRQSKGIR